MKNQRKTGNDGRNHDRGVGMTQRSISLPVQLLEMVDLAAKRVDRSRSGYVRHVLRDAVKRDLWQ